MRLASRPYVLSSRCSHHTLHQLKPSVVNDSRDRHEHCCEEECIVKTFECYSVPRSTSSMLHLRCVHTQSLLDTIEPHGREGCRPEVRGSTSTTTHSEASRAQSRIYCLVRVYTLGVPVYKMHSIPEQREYLLTFPSLSVPPDDPEVLNRQGATSWRSVLLVCLFWKGELRAAREVGLGSQCLCPHSLLLPSGHLPPLRDEPFQLTMHSPRLLQDALRYP